MAITPQFKENLMEEVLEEGDDREGPRLLIAV